MRRPTGKRVSAQGALRNRINYKMVFNYKRKSELGSTWTETSMEHALQAVRNGESIRKASLIYNIPFSTLLKHVKSNKTTKSLGRFKTVFTPEEEQEFVTHIKELDSRFYGLTRRDLCVLAYQYAEANHIIHCFKNNAAGHQWYQNFMKRHPELSLRTPEPTSVARASGFNRPQVERFFENLRDVIEKNNILPEHMYNVDETGIQTSRNRPPKVISLKGKKGVGAISSSERGTLVTALFCCSAAGAYIPPTLVFPRKKKNPRYMEGTPPGSSQLVTDSGWISSEAFLEWMKFFVSNVRPNEDHECLLILDNHAFHRSIDVLDYASQNNVIILSVPPHTTHKLQPLDVSVYGPFGTYFQNEIAKWQKAHPAQRVTLFGVGKIFNNAYLKAATPTNAIKEPEVRINHNPQDMDVIEIGPPNRSAHNDIAKPEPSGLNNSTTLKQASDAPKGNNRIKIIDIHIIPKCDKRKEPKTKRNQQKSEILTSTPIKEEIRENSKSKECVKSVRRKIQQETDSSKLKIPRPPSPPKTAPDEEETPCLICDDSFENSIPGEHWIQCNFCEKWAHQKCTSYKTGIDICQDCQNQVKDQRT
ncbi:unnamed protein product [Acanthoscelides obtectus]|uniref:DDE-1 domain-containing protein n=1 Tax=Acanthoscelides obtectus TaxID=200917 RepID=A0A9P0KGB9_ACAOB|nr:unnamed protein product [Acanthoscelides obtectus]CAK1656897.1 Jerky protein homolog-like [Acanthoscelides obtectus]